MRQFTLDDAVDLTALAVRLSELVSFRMTETGDGTEIRLSDEADKMDRAAQLRGIGGDRASAKTYETGATVYRLLARLAEYGEDRGPAKQVMQATAPRLIAELEKQAVQLHTVLQQVKVSLDSAVRVLEETTASLETGEEVGL